MIAFSQCVCVTYVYIYRIVNGDGKEATFSLHMIHKRTDFLIVKMGARSGQRQRQQQHTYVQHQTIHICCSGIL